MNNKNTVIASLALTLFIGIIAFMTINSASYASNKNRGTSNQQNSCGNDDLIMNIICQNKDSKDHGVMPILSLISATRVLSVFVLTY